MSTMKRITYGFTLIEMLVVMSVLGIVLALVVDGYQASYRRSILNSQTDTLIGAIRDTQRRAIAADQGSGWTISCNGSTVQQGPDAQPATQTIALTAAVTCSGAPQVSFSKLTGTPSDATAFTVTLSGAGTKTISVTKAGSIEETSS